MNEQLHPHPLATIVPEATNDELHALVRDVLKQGLIEPITLYEGQILDGRHRYEACRRTKTELRTVDFEGDEAAARAFVVSKNLARRHLTEGQRAIVAARLVTTEGKGRPVNGSIDPFTAADAAKSAQTSEPTVKRARKVLDATPELIEAVEGGKVAVSDAAAIAGKPEEVQRAAVAAVEEGKAKTLKKAVVAEEREVRQEAARAETAPMPEDACIVHAPCHHLPQWVKPGSLDAIFTDPPYEESALPLWSDLAQIAITTLKPGGVILAITGHAWLPEILDRLRVDGLSFRWIVAYTYPKSRAPMHGRGVSVGWKPLVAFTRDGAKPARMSNDVFHAGPKGREDKTAHEWGQTEADMEAIAREWTQPGWHVADPFCGAGSLLVAAKRAGCIVTGCDIDEAHVNTSRRKLA